MIWLALLACAPGCSPGLESDAPPPSIEKSRVKRDLQVAVREVPPPKAPSQAPTPSQEAAPPAGSLEVEALLRMIQHMTPPQKVKAYQRLLNSGQEGVEEVFLVGLNEDDPDILEVVVSYFKVHHPEAAMEPLVAVLLFVQGDKALRTQVGETLASFGEPALGPILKTLSEEPPARLAGGAMAGLEVAITAIVAEGGAPLLNRYLREGGRHGVTLLGPLTQGPEGGAIPGDEDTIGLLHGILEKELRPRRRDPAVVDATLALLCRIAQGEVLPTNVAIISPLVPGALRASPSLWGLYTAVLFGDESSTPSLLRELESGGQRRFWALQALGVIGDERAVPAVMKSLQAQEEDVRAVAAWCIRHRLWRRASPALREALGRPSPPTMALIEATEALGDRAAAPLLEASLAGAPRALQSAILRGLLPVADKALAQRIAGWLEVEILAPMSSGRVTLEDSPTRDVLEGGIWIVAAYGDDGGELALELVRRAGLRGPSVPWIKTIARGGAQALPGALERAFLGDGQAPDPQIARQLILLAQGLGGDDRGAPGAEIRAVLERMLLNAKAGESRALAAQGLYHVGSVASRPALTDALKDSYFVPGPFPLFEYPVRRLAALALERQRVDVISRVDRTYALN